MTPRKNRQGFSLVELMVAVFILTWGILAVAGGALYTTRNLQRSKMSTLAAGLTAAKLDELLSYSKATEPECSSNLFASSTAAVVTNRVSLTWTVPASGALRTVRIFARYQLSKGVTRIDTLTARVAC
jgi:prepilin-type N-terminal cleavage/methylation domain-containing protein